MLKLCAIPRHEGREGQKEEPVTGHLSTQIITKGLSTFQLQFEANFLAVGQKQVQGPVPRQDLSLWLL